MTTSRTCLLALLASCAVGCGGPPRPVVESPVVESPVAAGPEPPRPAAPPSNPPPAPPPCEAEPPRELAALMAALGPAAPSMLEGSEPRVVLAQLDGAGPMEAALVARVAGDTFGDHPSADPDRGATDHLWVLRRTGDAWVVAGHRTFDATQDHGTFEYAAGVTSVRAEPLLGPSHDVLLVTSEQGQGGVDPRWLEHRTALFGLGAGGLQRLFACATRREDVSGPARAGVVVTRRITLHRGPRPTLTVVGSVREDPGVVEPDPASGGASVRALAGEYRLGPDGFVPVGPDVCDGS